MLWEIEIEPKGADAERQRVCEELDLLTHRHDAATFISRSARGYLVEGNLSVQHAERLLHELFVDPLIETGRVQGLGDHGSQHAVKDQSITVLLKPGVMDPVALSVAEAA